MDTPAWIADGYCHNKPHLTFLFYSDQPSEQESAKRMCTVCPVKAQCLVAALERNERFGIWGGTSPADRKRLKARLNL